MNEFEKGLPKLHIPGVYLSLYENPLKPEEWSGLRLAYNENGRIHVSPEGIRFPSPQLVSEGMWPEKCSNYITTPLFFQDHQLGFILFEVGPRLGEMYETLRMQLSTALFGTMLLKKSQDNAAGIARQKYILDTFTETIPERIYFKDLEGRIISRNNAYAMRMGLKNTDEGIGKTDFDFFTEEEANIKFNHEKNIIKTGKPIIALEEKRIKQDGTMDWSLTTQMPLRNENNEIIGTFGISHDITELKQTQNSLENANLEIVELNIKLKDENLTMNMEMELAHQIQTSLLPENIDNIHRDFEITAKMLPAESVGGDYYDISLDQSGSLWIGIGDVSGHGVTPGLIMMMAQTIHSSITNNYNVSPKELVRMINGVLMKNVQGRMKKNHFMTFVTLKYQGDGIFQHAGAHLKMIVYRKEKKQFDLIPTSGPWLNVLPEVSKITKNNSFSLDIGDILILFTDGITEAENHKDELLDLSGFIEIIQKHIDKEVGVMGDNILNDVLNMCKGKQEDDITMVIVKRINKNGRNKNVI